MITYKGRHETGIGPEADQLLASLQTFILCIIRSQSMGQVEVDLTDAGMSRQITMSQRCSFFLTIVKDRTRASLELNEDKEGIH
jgi:hypothetical protein